MSFVRNLGVVRAVAFSNMTLWRFRTDLKKYSYRGSVRIGVYQLWWGRTIWQLVREHNAGMHGWPTTRAVLLVGAFCLWLWFMIFKVIF